MQCNDGPARVTLLVVLCIAAFCLPALAVEVPESPPAYVVDLAGVINDSVEHDLNGYLQELEQKTTAQMIVLTVPDLEGAEIRDFALTLAHDKWKLGQKSKDNGLLLLVAVKDREYTIETGYGIEGIIPDSLAGEIGRRFFVPYFRKNDYSTGIYTGSLALANAIAQDAGVTISGMPRVSGFGSGSGRQSSGPLGKIATVLFLIFVLYMFIRHPRALLTMFLLSSMGGGGRRGGWGGGGGGFGGFGGGGGGGFGGGGASGSW